MLKSDVLPGYGLSGYELVEGSTPAMLAELKRSIEAKDPVAIAPWRPHSIGRKGFDKEYPDVAKMLAGFQLDDESLGSLENLVLNKYREGQEKKAVTEWLKANPGIMHAKATTG